jgi:hypothetical protein
MIGKEAVKQENRIEHDLTCLEAPKEAWFRHLGMPETIIFEKNKSIRGLPYFLC